MNGDLVLPAVSVDIILGIKGSYVQLVTSVSYMVTYLRDELSVVFVSPDSFFFKVSEI
jgi:hypothetical protein